MLHMGFAFEILIFSLFFTFFFFSKIFEKSSKKVRKYFKKRQSRDKISQVAVFNAETVVEQVFILVG